MVVIAAEDIPAGREVRWDYDHTAGRPFRAAMIARGITAEELGRLRGCGMDGSKQRSNAAAGRGVPLCDD